MGINLIILRQPHLKTKGRRPSSLRFNRLNHPNLHPPHSLHPIPLPTRSLLAPCQTPRQRVAPPQRHSRRLPEGHGLSLGISDSKRNGWTNGCTFFLSKPYWNLEIHVFDDVSKLATQWVSIRMVENHIQCVIKKDKLGRCSLFIRYQKNADCYRFQPLETGRVKTSPNRTMYPNHQIKIPLNHVKSPWNPLKSHLLVGWTYPDPRSTCLQSALPQGGPCSHGRRDAALPALLFRTFQGIHKLRVTYADRWGCHPKTQGIW